MAEKPKFLKSVPGGVTVAVRVQPRSSKRGPVGFWGPGEEYLKWMVGAAPSDGEANSELVRGVGKFFGVPKSRVRIVQGEGKREKVLMLEGVTEPGVKARLKELGILAP